MNAALRYHIKKCAEQANADADVQIPVRDIELVVKKMGGRVVFPKGFDDVSEGSVKKRGEKGFEIRVQPSVRQDKRKLNFAVAREIGHLYLHMGFDAKQEKWSEQGSEYKKFTAEQEQEANEFAVAFLMPKSDFSAALYRLKRNGDINIAELAEYFNVTEASARNRGGILGYWGRDDKNNYV